MNDKYFAQTFFDKSDRELHDMIYSGRYTDPGFINAAIEEQRYRRAIKSLNNFTGFLDEEIMKLLKREDIFPSDVNRKIRDEAEKRKLVAPRLYFKDLHKQTIRNEESEMHTTSQHKSLIYNEIKDKPSKAPLSGDEKKQTPPPTYVPPAEQQSKADSHQNPDKIHEPIKRNPMTYRSNYWLVKSGKYILILAATVLLFLIIDILKPDLKTNLFKPSDSTLIEKIEKPIKSLGNKIGMNSGKLLPVQAENLLKEKYQFDILAFPLFDGSANKENTKLRYEKLQNEGLINYSNCSDGVISGYCATLTEKGKLYAISEVYKDELDSRNYVNVRSTILDVGKILDIKRSTQFDGFEVEFTLKIMATPFGVIWSDLKTVTLTKTDFFEKHGEVWRIKSSM